MAINSEILKKEYPKFKGFEGVSHKVIDRIQSYYSDEKYTSIERVKGANSASDGFVVKRDNRKDHHDILRYYG